MTTQLYNKSHTFTQELDTDGTAPGAVRCVSRSRTLGCELQRIKAVNYGHWRTASTPEQGEKGHDLCGQN